jgi:hypothetical protein
MATRAARSPQFRAVPILGRARAAAPSGGGGLADLPVVQLKNVRFVGQGSATRVEVVPNLRATPTGYTTVPSYTKAPPSLINGNAATNYTKAPPTAITAPASGNYTYTKAPPPGATSSQITAAQAKNDPRVFDSVQIQY